MGLTAEQLRTGLDLIAAREPRMAAALARVGYPEPRIRPPGYGTLLRTIVGQQLSIKAADSIWLKLAQTVGEVVNPAAMLTADDADLRRAGLSRQKIGYVRSLAEQVAAGALDLDRLPDADDAAIARLMQVSGIGRWSAEIYLLFAEGRPDIWPAGDLGVQIESGRIMQLEARPSENATRALAENWRPWRGAAAVFMWHHYRSEMV